MGNFLIPTPKNHSGKVVKCVQGPGDPIYLFQVAHVLKKESSTCMTTVIFLGGEVFQKAGQRNIKRSWQTGVLNKD